MIYDCQKARKNRSTGTGKDIKQWFIEGEYVTHLYSSTPDAFIENITYENFKNGYGFRWLYAFPTYKKSRMRFGFEDETIIKAKSDIILAANLIKLRLERAGKFEFTMTDEALDLYNDTYENMEDIGDSLTEEDSKAVSSAVGRSAEHILKIAMAIEIGKSTKTIDNLSRVISKESIAVAAMMVLKFYLPSYIRIFSEVSTHDSKNRMEKAIAVIRNCGGTCSRATLIRNGHFTKRELDELIPSMIEGNIIAEKTVKGKKGSIFVLVSDKKGIDFDDSFMKYISPEIRKISDTSRLVPEIKV